LNVTIVAAPAVAANAGIISSSASGRDGHHEKNARDGEIRRLEYPPEVEAMNAIKATWTNGQIVPAEAIDWPEGSELVVEPVVPSEKIGLDEIEWRDDPQSIADWIAWVDTIKAMEL
jgi:hypothetical protein